MAGIDGVGRVGIRSYVAPVSLSSIVTNGLVLSLDASNPLSYSGSGTTWTDLSGNGNNGTLTNGTSYSSANGGTLTFDGINDYVDTNLVTNQSAFTYCIWGKSSTVGYPNRIMGNCDSLAGLNGAVIFWGIPYDSANKIWFARRTENNYSRDIKSTEIAGFSGNWHYIVATYDSVNGSKFYCDNVLVGSNATTGFISTLKLRIGKDGNGADAFLGNIAAVQVYNKALSSAEVEQNFNASKARFGFVSYTTRTAAFATATGITDATILNALNTFDTGLISNGLDTKMKALYPFVGGTSTTHKFNFMDARDVDAAFRLSFNGGWIHSSTGALPNGTNAYADSFWIASAQSTNDNISYNYYSRTNTSGAANFGGSGGGYVGTTAMYISLNGASNYATINGMGYLATSSTDSRGLFGMNTTTNNIFTSWKNGNKSGTRNYTTDNGYFGITNVSLWIGGCRSPSAEYGNMECAFFNMSTGLSDSEQSTFYNLVQTLQTSLSRNV